MDPYLNAASHVLIDRITQLNNNQLANSAAPPPIAAGIAATAMGALVMTQAGMQVPVVIINPLLGK